MVLVVVLDHVTGSGDGMARRRRRSIPIFIVWSQHCDPTLGKSIYGALAWVQISGRRQAVIKRLLEWRRTAAIIYAITKLDYMRLLKDYLGLFSLGSRGQSNLMYTSPCGPLPVAINMFKLTLFNFFNKKG